MINAIKSFFKKITPDIDFCLGEIPAVPKDSTKLKKKDKRAKNPKKSYVDNTIDFNEYF